MALSPTQLGVFCLLSCLTAGASDRGQATIVPLYSFAGEVTFDNLGFSVAPLPDLDGDGVGEILVGAPNRKPGYAFIGHAYVLSGANGSLLRKHDGISLSDRFGHAVSVLPDLNGDGVPEYAVGAIWAVDLHVGHKTEMPGATSIYDGASGALLQHNSGLGKFECHGSAIVPLDDVNGDGIADFAVSARFGGAVDGVPSTAPGYVRILSGADSSILLQIAGNNAGDYLGERMIGIPDVDGDGLGDLAAGAYAYPSLGKRGQVLLISSATGAVVRTIEGKVDGDWFGWSLALTQDLDGDGVRDLAIGAPQAKGQAGQVTVVSLMTGAPLRRIDGVSAKAQFGCSLAPVGDIDGDGVGDLMAGSPFFDGARGRVDVVSLGSGAFLASMEGREVGDHFGEALANVGDLTGDGESEVAIGVTGAQGGTHHGALLVVSIQ